MLLTVWYWLDSMRLYGFYQWLDCSNLSFFIFFRCISTYPGSKTQCYIFVQEYLSFFNFTIQILFFRCISTCPGWKTQCYIL